MKKLILLFVLQYVISFHSYAQWNNQNSQTTDLLGGIRFISDSIGWVFGTDQLMANNIYKSTDTGNNWSSNFSTDGPITSAFFLNNNHCWFTDLDEGSSRLFFSSNAGGSWSTIYSNTYFFYDLHFFNSNDGLAFGFYRINGNVGIGSIFRTNNSGSSWSIIRSGDLLYLRCFFLDSLNGWCGGSADIGMNSIKRTTNSGISWTDVPSSTINNIRKIQFLNNESGWVLAENDLYNTTNAGLSWDLKFNYVNDFYFIGERNGWCLTSDKIYNTIDGGNTWILQHSNNGKNLYGISFKSLEVGWACGDSGSVLKTLNGGIPVELTSFASSVYENDVTLTWTTATETNNQGFQIERRKTQEERNEEWENISFVSGNGTTTEPQAYSFVDENLQAGKYQYRLKQIDFDGTFEYSNTIKVEITAPTKFSLEQNYPNPFNPSTNIQYAISSRQFITLKVYDVLGKGVTTLVTEEKPAGSFNVYFNASHLASGIYYYQLRAGDFVETKKMILMK